MILFNIFKAVKIYVLLIGGDRAIHIALVVKNLDSAYPVGPIKSIS